VEVIYARVVTKRQQQLHGRAAHVLSGRSDAARGTSALAVAEHFLRAGHALTARAIDWVLRGTEVAAAERAYERAASVLLRALDLIGHDDGRRLDVQIAAANMLWRCCRFDDAKDVARDALDASRRLDDAASFARSALALAGPPVGFGAIPYDEGLVAALRDALAVLPDGDHPLRARVLARLAEQRVFEVRDGRAWSLALDAIAMARRLDEPDLRAYVLSTTAWARSEPLAVEDRRNVARELINLGQKLKRPDIELEGRLIRLWVNFELGNLVGVRQSLAACQRSAREVAEPYYGWLVALADVCLKIAEGRLDEAELQMQHALTLGQQGEHTNAALFFGIQQATAWFARGMFAEVRGGLRGLEQRFPLLGEVVRCGIAATYAEEGRPDEARMLLRRIVADELDNMPRTVTWLPSVVFVAEACAAVGDRDHAGRLYELLQPFEGHYVTLPPVCVYGSVDSYLARLAALAGRMDAAVAHGEAAVQIEGRLQNPYWRLRAEISLAEILLERGDPADGARLVELIDGARRALAQRDVPAPALESRLAAVCRPAQVTHIAQSPGRGIFELDGDVVRITYGPTTFTLRRSKGLDYLGILLAHPGLVIHVFDLKRARDGGGPREITADDGYLQKWRAQVHEAKRNLEAAERDNDLGGIEKWREVLDFLLANPPQVRNPDVERLRTAISRAIGDAYEKIAKDAPLLLAHLKSHVRPGALCTYMPDAEHPIEWIVVWGRRR
jgi:tetratricopeptide (TPR) repeat protein